MTTDIKNFIKISSIVGVILLAFVLISQFFIVKAYTAGNYITVLVNWLITVLMYVINKKTSNKEIPSSFINTFMATSIGKMFVLMIYMVGYVFLFGEEKIIFLVFMLVCYTIYTIFEIYHILKEQKSDNL